MSFTHPLATILCLLVTQGNFADGKAAPQCKRFDEIYATGKELCENMWDGAFVYEPVESKGYTQWFFDAVNPNDATARALGKLGTAGHDTCHLDYYHKDAPGPEPDNFTECHPWKKEACCHQGTVMTHTKLNEGYGKEYHWDRCGALSPECERFFVQEACFYECDPNAGLYRKFHPASMATRPGSAVHDASNADHNKWQMHAMPIKKSYCDAWFTACRKDKFCASGGGSFFSCAAEYKAFDQVAELQAALQRAKGDQDDEMDVGIIVGFVAAGVAICALLAFGCCLISKEKAGKPMFSNLLDSPPNPAGGQSMGLDRLGDSPPNPAESGKAGA